MTVQSSTGKKDEVIKVDVLEDLGCEVCFMYIHVADRVPAGPSGKREMSRGEGKRRRQGGEDVESCVGGGQRHLARKPRERENHVQGSVSKREKKELLRATTRHR